MQVQSLEAFGVHCDLLRAWEDNYSKELLPVQAEAVSEGKVLSGTSLIVYAPTGAGKTFVGEMAAMHAATAGRLTIYLVPTKALAEEKYALFCHLYGTLGLDIAISTRDRREADEQVSRGQFDLLLTVPEKLRFLLSRAPGIAGRLGTVVVDELQLVGDPVRGPCLEVVLAQIISQAHPQIVGLSAVIDQPQMLAEWLDARVISVHKRPVELRKGVLVDSVFRYQEHNSGRVGEEDFGIDIAEGDFGGAVLAVTLQLTAQGEPTLVFVKDRRNSVRWAYRLAERVSLPPAQQAIEQLAALPPTSTRQRLMELLEDGVAFHNADLQFADRQIIEAAMRRGEIGALCSTSTLAMGVNLPARNVIVESHCWANTSGLQRPTVRPITRAEFENMGGRAGRLHFSEQFGRAILLAETDFVAEMMFQRYITSDFASLESALAQQKPLAQLLTLCSAGPQADQGDLARLYRHTLAAHLQEEYDTTQLPAGLREAFPAALQHHLLHKDELTAELTVTPQGRLCSSSGLTLPDLRWLTMWISEWDDQPPDELTLLLVACAAPEAQQLRFTTRSGQRREDPLSRLQQAAEQWGEDGGELARIVHHPALDGYAATRSTHLSVVLLDWIGPEATMDIERRWQMAAGRLQAAAETIGWLMHTAVSLGQYAGWPTGACRQLRSFAERVIAGVAEEYLSLQRAADRRLDRDQIQILVSAGITEAAQLRNLTVEQQAELLGTPELAQPAPLADKAKKSELPRSQTQAGTDEPVVQISEARPDRVIFRGQEVALRPAEYKLLRALARRPQQCVRYQEIYDQIWGPDEIVEPGQVYWHRSQLVKKLRYIGGEQGDKAVPIRTLPRRGYMLDVEPERVKVR
ncbi:MAG: DEAD/DEAH box helicase [Armatimonadetes bacterium]|nr:DEAD/DEAH box helicase [Armatimonadota bacterium]